jgi:phytoene synthase
VVTLAEAYAACERLAQSHYENFPVASLLLPAPMRPHIAAIYAFARAADDFADEGTDPPETRRQRLDDWLGQLHARVEGGATPPASPVLVALAETICVHSLPLSLFDDLISAFRQDVTTNRYDTWADLLDYCRRSANPVGRLVLRVAGYADGTLDRASDDVCTALQLVNFWQDLERDWQKGRLYVPRADRERWSADDAALARRAWTPGWRAVMADVGGRTRRLFDDGRRVCDDVHGRLRLELRFTWLGGRRILDKLDAAGYDVFGSRPALGKADLPVLIWQAATWSRQAAVGG